MHVFALVVASVSANTDPVAITKYGITRGLYRAPCEGCLPRIPYGVDAFLGIPYAQPPVGELRLAKPQRFAGKLPTVVHTLPPECPQKAKGVATSEDCLYLNIYRKSSWGRAKLKPVMVWIHGGAFKGGSGGRFDGGPLAAGEDVIVVMVNYRLGLLGFFNGQNFGQLDQRMALEWVKENISDFGGDPMRITLFGESSGAAGVLWHLLTDGSKKLFNAAILQSTPMTSVSFMNMKKAERFTAWAAEEFVGCKVDDFACLRKAPVEKFIINTKSPGNPKYANPMYPKVQVGITVGDAEMPQEPWKLLHKLPSIPIIVGWTQHEGSGLVPYLPAIFKDAQLPLTVEGWKKILKLWIPTQYERLLQAYQPDMYIDALHETRGVFALARDMISDAMFICPSLQLSAANNLIKSYVFSPLDLYGSLETVRKGGVPLKDYGAYHCSDTPYVFRAFRSWGTLVGQVVTFSLFNDPRQAVKAFHMTGEGKYNHYKNMTESIGCVWTNLHKNTLLFDCRIDFGNFGKQRQVQQIDAHSWRSIVQPERGQRVVSVLPSVELCNLWSEVEYSWERA